MKIRIEQISSKDVDTKYGKKTKLGIRSGKNWYGAWLNNTTKEWQEGDEIDVEVAEREWQGKTYYDIVLPKEGKGVPTADLKLIHEKLDTILSLITSQRPAVQAAKEALGADDIPF